LRDFKKTLKQSFAIDLMTKFIEVLLEGGSRSGKTFIACYAIIARALKYKDSRHLIVRKHFNHIKTTIWYQTLPNVIKKAFPNAKYKENKSDWYIQFDNGAQNAIEYKNSSGYKKTFINDSLCLSCGDCKNICPNNAIMEE